MKDGGHSSIGRVSPISDRARAIDRKVGCSGLAVVAPALTPEQAGPTVRCSGEPQSASHPGTARCSTGYTGVDPGSAPDATLVLSYNIPTMTRGRGPGRRLTNRSAVRQPLPSHGCHKGGCERRPAMSAGLPSTSGWEMVTPQRYPSRSTPGVERFSQSPHSSIRI